MKTKIIGIIVIVIVIGLVAIGFSYTGSEPYWETETEFGMWQDELIVTFADGSTESMKIISEESERPFTVYYGGKAITSVRIKLTASVSGTGFQGAEIRTASFGYNGYIRTTTGQDIDYIPARRQDTTNTVSIGSTITLIDSGSTINLKTKIDDRPDRYPDGNYIILFRPMGTVDYRGYPDGAEWISASLPPERSITINVQRAPTGSILVTLSSGATTL